MSRDTVGEGVGWGTGSVGEGGFSMGEKKKSEEEGCALFGEATLDSCVKKRNKDGCCSG